MKRTALIVLMGVAAFATAIPAARAQTVVTPTGGMTMKTVQLRKDGVVLVTFVESFSELSVCTPYVFGAVTYAQPVWIQSPQSAAASRQLYALALAASLTGRKLAEVSFDLVNGECLLYTMRLDQ